MLKVVKGLVLKKLDQQSRWDLHILPVVKYAKKLGKIYHADLEVLEISAFLHDLTRMTGDKNNHHISSALIAGDLLSELGFPEKRVKLVQDCIRNHRGSLNSERKTIEEVILTTSDAMAHIMFPLPMFWGCYKETQKNLSISEGRDWVLSKVLRSYKKIYFPEARKLVSKKYAAIKLVLS